jgi:hypothetical protein
LFHLTYKFSNPNPPFYLNLEESATPFAQYATPFAYFRTELRIISHNMLDLEQSATQYA